MSNSSSPYHPQEEIEGNQACRDNSPVRTLLAAEVPHNSQSLPPGASTSFCLTTSSNQGGATVNSNTISPRNAQGDHTIIAELPPNGPLVNSVERSAHNLTNGRREQSLPGSSIGLHSEERCASINGQESISEKVARCTISATRPITGLPDLPAQELPYIGQSVSFLAETTTDDDAESTEWMYYEGLISMVTYASISLINASRFTRQDYDNFVLQREHMSEEEQQRNDPFFSSMNVITTRGKDNSPRSRSLNSGPHPFAPLYPIVMADKQEARRPVTMGPFPFLSFCRKSLINIEFIESPPSSSFSLFSNSSSRIMDTQYLRIFVRRYLVHMCRDKNDKFEKMTLKDYITARCNAKDIDIDLLEEIAKEELRVLLEANEKILMAQTNSFRYRGELDLIGGESTALEILISTGIPHHTLTVATIMGMAILCGLLYGLFFLFAVSKPSVIDDYLMDQWPIFFLGFIFSCPAVLAVGYHGAIMRPPQSSQYGMSILRAILTIGGIIMTLTCFVLLQHLYRESSAEKYYLQGKENGRACIFFRELHCSGWSEPNVWYASLECPDSIIYLMACNTSFLSKVRMIIVPVMIAQVSLIFVSFLSLGLLVAMFYYIREIYHRRMRVTGIRV